MAGKAPILIEALRSAILAPAGPLPVCADWPGLLAAALPHGVAPYLFPAVARTPGVPPEVLAAWRTAAFVAARHGVRMECATAAVYRALGATGIPVVALKGAFLAERLYDEPGQRPSGDIDVLIPRDCVTRACAALSPLGYAPHGVADANPVTKDLPLYHSEGGPPVELHWQLTGRQSGLTGDVDIDAFWAAAREARVAGVTVQVPSAEDQLLHLCLHAMHHRYIVPLRMLLDMALALRWVGQGGPAAAGLSWDAARFWQRARAWRIERAVAFHLLVVRDLFDLPLPAGLTPQVDPDWATAERVWVMSGAVVPPEEVVLTDRSLARLARAGGVGAKLRLAGRRIFLPLAEARLIYPSWLRARWLLPVAWGCRAVTFGTRYVSAGLGLDRHRGRRAARQALAHMCERERILAWLADIRPRTSDLGPRTSDAGPRTPGLGRRAPHNPHNPLGGRRAFL
jgi:hypothetical protein